MSIHLVVGLSGVGKSTVLRQILAVHQDCEVVSFSAFAIEYIAKKTGAAVDRSTLAAALTHDASLKNECVSSLAERIAAVAEGRKVIVDSGGSLVNLKSGSLISSYSLFQGLDLCSVSVVLTDALQLLKRLRGDKNWHAYGQLNEPQLAQKNEDIRLYGLAMAVRKNCSLILAWNNEINECAETLYDGMVRAETARRYLLER